MDQPDLESTFRVGELTNVIKKHYRDGRIPNQVASEHLRALHGALEDYLSIHNEPRIRFKMTHRPDVLILTSEWPVVAEWENADLNQWVRVRRCKLTAFYLVFARNGDKYAGYLSDEPKTPVDCQVFDLIHEAVDALDLPAVTVEIVQQRVEPVSL